MKLKEFFKSQTFKCILVLLIIALISGGLLAIMNDLLFVSQDERTARAIKAIYGTQMDYETIYDIDDAEDKDGASAENVGYVEKCYYLPADGNYLIKATGLDGYKKGTISVWAVVTPDGKIDKLSIAEYDKQTLMSKFDGGVMKDGINVANSVDLATASPEDRVVVSGATFSAKAFNNALCAVQNYYKTVLGATHDAE